MSRVALTLALALALIGCTRSRPLDTLPFNESLRVETIDGETVDATWTHDLVIRTRDGRTLEPSRIARAVEVRRGRGAIDGYYAGAAAGLAVGVTTGFVLGDDDCDACYLSWSAEIKAVALGALGVAAGGAVGALIGAIVGSRDVFHFRDPQREFWIVPAHNGASVGVAF